MKLHELRPAPGSRRDRTRVGRGIAAGKGKTAGRGTKGQKSRAGAGIPPWFEGGQTPIHVRVPKLRGFRNPFKVVYQVVNVGRIAEYAEAGRFGVEAAPAKGKAKAGDSPVTVNPENMAAAGLIGSSTRPVKVLGQGDVSSRLLVVADAFTASARSKIEAAGGFVQLVDEPAEPASEDEPRKVGKREQRKIAGRAAAEARATRTATVEPDATSTKPSRARAAKPADTHVAATSPGPTGQAEADTEPAAAEGDGSSDAG